MFVVRLAMYYSPPSTGTRDRMVPPSPGLRRLGFALEIVLLQIFQQS